MFSGSCMKWVFQRLFLVISLVELIGSLNSAK